MAVLDGRPKKSKLNALGKWLCLFLALPLLLEAAPANTSPAVAAGFDYAATIDLSQATTSGPGYDVSGTTPSYVSPNGPVSNPDRILTFTADAAGKSYRITQSGMRSAPPSMSAPKEGTSLFYKVVVPDAVSVTLVTSAIDLTGTIELAGSADVSLMLDGTSYVRGYIEVPQAAKLTIDSLNGSDTGDRLVIPSKSNSASTHASIGGTGGVGNGAGGKSGTITINGGGIDVTAHSVGAGIGGGGGGGSNENGGAGGDAGAITITGGNVSVTQYGSGSDDGAGIAGAGIGGGGGLSTNGGEADAIRISGGKVTVRQYTRAAGIGGGAHGQAGTVIIDGGVVDVEVIRAVDVKGAGEGSGIGCASGTSGTGVTDITINGGTVKSVAGDVGAGIGGVNGGRPIQVKITGGDVFAKSAAGSGIGSLFGSAQDSISITGGTVVADSGMSAAIGARGGTLPSLELGADADVQAYSGMGIAAITVGSNTGPGYFVNAQLNTAISTTADTALHVFASGEPPLNLTLPAGYRGFAYGSSGSAPRTDTVIAFNGAARLGTVVRSSDGNSQLYSINQLAEYDLYNGKAKNGVLPVRFSASASTFGGEIDLSTTTTDGEGYKVTGVTAGVDEYLSRYPQSDGQVTTPTGVLAFGGAADGETFRIVQSGVLASPDDPAAPKTGTSIFGAIEVEDGVNITLMLESIDLTGNILVYGNGNATLLLGVDRTHLTGAPTANFVRGSVAAREVGSGVIASVRIDANDADGALTVITTDAGRAGIGGDSGHAAGNIAIDGGRVTVTVSGLGAGIGGGAFGGGGSISITGGTVLATAAAGAGIGGGYSAPNFPTAGATLSVDAGANVTAYSAGKAAIHANGPNGGNGYYVDAVLDKPLSDTSATDIYVFPDNYTGGQLADRVGTLSLPSGYRYFAYTTGTTVSRVDNLYAGLAPTDIRVIGRVKDDAKQIYSVATLDGYDSDNPAKSKGTGLLEVKLRQVPIAGVPSVSNVGKYAADLTSTGQDVSGQTFLGGGFVIADALDANGRPDAARAVTLPWPSSGFDANPVTLTTTTKLLPNTQYFVIAYLSVNADLYLDPPPGEQRFESADVAEFVTEPATFSWTFYKVGEADAPLTNVHFSLRACDPTCADAQDATSAADGLVEFTGLEPGRYLLAETKTNPGYQLPAGQWNVDFDPDGVATITAQGDDSVSLPPAFKPGAGKYEGHLLLPNYPQPGMPVLGGAGVIGWVVGGVVLLGCALLGAVSRQGGGLVRRKEATPRLAATKDVR